MKIYRIYLLAWLIFILSANLYATGNTDSLYRIVGIQTRGDYYVIRAQRNDSLFKIVSRIVSLDSNSNLELIRKGNKYNFIWGIHDRNTSAIVEPLVGNASYLHVKKRRYWDDNKIKFTKRFHYRLYNTRNLIGLYYVPSAFIYCREKYLNRVLDSDSNSRYFVVIKAKINEVEKEIVVLNKSLLDIMNLRDPKYKDKEVYKNYLKQIILTNKSICFTESEYKKMDAGTIVSESILVDSLQLQKGDLLNNYFYVSEKYNYAVLKHDVQQYKIGAIMKLMFESNYLMSMVEGRLTIEDLKYCR
ncbi:hypothetical protein GCM10027036_23650 [Flavihumibacter cheonanensis]|jgi:hypothetical protein|uniref:hypothetical protein n=1 Tax=Flavihumibacter cheonanensis TaxID=1442385 RepID=UPI001EF84B60|nr:hypothetical protein [Flavihumibacter cheonanensis]MCG7754492.1 hypothetical protein [Flavihumibacter cheonanensis]